MIGESVDVKVSIDQFLRKFNFQEEKKGFIGIERERFLVSPAGEIVPHSTDFLKIVNDPKWTYELSACQVEDRTVPKKRLKDIQRELSINDRTGHLVAENLGLSLCSIEVGPENMPLDVYPDPRYLRIVKNISKEELRAACRVTGTHIHIGMPDIETAIQTANYLRDYLDYFCSIGDHSNGERLRLYKIMATDWKPPEYSSIEHFFRTAHQKGFVRNPRNCWHLVRLSIHGTVELRMFGVTENIEEIISWVSVVHRF